MPTLAALRRRGFSPEAIRAFCDMVGVAKANSMVDIGKLEYCVRDDLNTNAPRALGVLQPVEVELVGAGVMTPGTKPASMALDAPYFPPDVGKPGSRPVPLGTRIFIDRDDWRDDPPSGYQRLAPGRTVRLRYGPCITADEVVARDDAGRVLKLRATVVPDTLAGKNPSDGRVVSGVIHWVDAATSVACEVRLYERLFKVPRPEEGGGDFLDHLDRDSLQVVTGARLEASLASAAVGSRWQLERVGYFIVDQDSRPGLPVLNRIVTLRDVEKPKLAAAPVEKKTNVKATTRPKSKSPAEYRTEARARDSYLAGVYATAQALGLSADHADLVSGETAVAQLFEHTANATNADLVAKWIINELPRALAGKELADAGLDHVRFSELLTLVSSQALTTNAAKQVLAQMIATGKRAGELAAAVPASASTSDLGAAIDAVIAANPDKAAQYKAGKTGLLGFFVGQVMKATPNADAGAVNQAIRDRLT
jgi:glutaminyl-tRNA synthetase